MVREKDVNQRVSPEETQRPVISRTHKPLEAGLRYIVPWEYVTYLLDKAYKKSKPCLDDTIFYLRFLDNLDKVLYEDPPDRFKRKPLTFQDGAGI